MVDSQRVRTVLAEHLDGYQVDSVVVLGAGQDNTAYEVNGELVVRFARAPERVSREALLLDAVAAVSPVPVPRPLFAEHGCLVYPKLTGTPLLHLPRPADVTPILATVREVLAAVPHARVAGLVELDDDPLPNWLADAARLYPDVRAELPAGYRAAVEAFLAAAPPVSGHTPVFAHNDLGIEHVLVDPVSCAVIGIIDWTDAALTDPAYDVGLLYRDLGPCALDVLCADAEVRERAVFYARCSMIEDLAYGLASGQTRYAVNALAAVAWLFGAGDRPAP